MSLTAKITLSNPIHKLLALTALLFLTQSYMSYNLWFDSVERSFPKFELLNLLGHGRKSWDLNNLLSLVSAACLVLTVVWGKFARWWLPLFFVSLGLLVLNDANRLQAWVYQYFLIFFAGYLYHRKGDISAAEKQQAEAYSLFLIKLVFIATYLWAGLNKLNIHYLSSVFNWLMGIFELTKPLKNSPYLALGSALVEIMVGIGLIFNRTKLLAVATAILMHSIILILLVKDGWNSVVYPWNVGMSLGLLLLFVPQNAPISWELLKKRISCWIYGFLLFLAPILNLFGCWQYNLSNTMYSGMSLEIELVLNDEGTGCFPEKFNDNQTYEYESDSSFAFDLDDWVMQELNVPYYAETWVARTLEQKYCPCLRQYNGFIRLEKSSRWSKEKSYTYIRCGEN